MQKGSLKLPFESPDGDEKHHAAQRANAFAALHPPGSWRAISASRSSSALALAAAQTEAGKLSSHSAVTCQCRCATILPESRQVDLGWSQLLAQHALHPGATASMQTMRSAALQIRRTRPHAHSRPRDRRPESQLPLRGSREASPPLQINAPPSVAHRGQFQPASEISICNASRCNLSKAGDAGDRPSLLAEGAERLRGHHTSTRSIPPWLARLTYSAIQFLAQNVTRHLDHVLVGFPADRCSDRCHSDSGLAGSWGSWSGILTLSWAPGWNCVVAQRGARLCGSPRSCGNGSAWRYRDASPQRAGFAAAALALEHVVAHQGLDGLHRVLLLHGRMAGVVGTGGTLVLQRDALFEQIFVDVDDAAAGKILSNW